MLLEFCIRLSFTEVDQTASLCVNYCLSNHLSLDPTPNIAPHVDYGTISSHGDASVSTLNIAVA